MTYFILIDNQQQGPFTIDELRQKNIAQDTLVWAEGMPQWTPAWQVEELKPLFFGQQTNGGLATPPPPPPITPSSMPVSDEGENKVPQKKKSHKAFYVAIAIIVIALFLVVLTNPGQAEHRQAILKKVDLATEQVDNIKDPMARAIARSIFGAGQGMMTEVVKELIDNNLEYHNYIFFSTTTLHSDLLQHDIRTSVGFLGNVNAVSLSNIIPDIITRQLGGSGSSNEEEESTQTTTDEDGNETTTTTKTVRKDGVTVDSLTKKVTNRIADDVAKEVKKQVRQETDSATASGIDAIVNDVVNFIKGL